MFLEQQLLLYINLEKVFKKSNLQISPYLQMVSH